MKRSLALATAAALLLVGCSSAPEQEEEVETAPATLGYVESIDELHDAYVNAGGVCNREERDPGQFYKESIDCADDAVLLTFATTRDRDEQVAVYDEMTSLLGPKTLLVGDNWILNAPDAIEMQSALGGQVVELG